jgi:hypothetical protein
METKRKEEERFAMRFFLFVLVMAIMGALSSCGSPKSLPECEAIALLKTGYLTSVDSTNKVLKGKMGQYRHHVYYYDSPNKNYRRVRN